MSKSVPTEIVTETLGVVTCPSVHDHGPAQLRFTYRLSDPLVVQVDAVSAVFLLQRFETSRKFIDESFSVTHFDISAYGDKLTARIRKSAPEQITLRWGTGYMVVIERQPVIMWLMKTYEVVATEAQECEYMNIDAVIGKLLAR